MRAAVVAIVMGAWSGSTAWADDPPGAGGSGDSDVAVAAAAGSGAASLPATDVTLEVLRAQPQVPTVRGGTLGIPAVLGTESLQATLSTQPGASSTNTQQLPGKIGFDLFTRLGGLRLFDSFTVDILAESYKQALPHADLMVRPVVPQMTLTGIRDIGFRAQWSAGRDTKISEIKRSAATAAGNGESVVGSVVDQFIRRHRFAITSGVRFLQRTDFASDVLDFQGASAELIGQYTLSRIGDDEACKAKHLDSLRTGVNKLTTQAKDIPEPSSAAPARAAAVSSVKQDAHSVEGVLAQPGGELSDRELDKIDDQLRKFSLHTRELKSLTPDGHADVDKLSALQTTATTTLTSAIGANTGCKTGGYGVTFFLGWSGSLLHTQKFEDDTRNSVEPLFRELRMSFGGDLRTTFTGTGTTLLPRIGAYATLSWGWWQDRVTGTPMPDQDPHSFQLEGAFYVSGHLASGFDAVVSFVALKPYGRSGTQFLVNVAPAIGAAIGGN